MRRILLGLLMVAAAGMAARAAADRPESVPKPAGPARVELGLSDGSRVIGQPGADHLDVHTHLGDISLKWSDVANIEWKPGESDALFNLANGDTLTGRLDAEKLQLKTSFGDVAVPMVHVRRVMSVGEGGAEMVLSLGDGVTMRLVFIRPGKFTGTLGGGQPHEVTLTKPFYMATTPVTQDQYQQIMGANPSHFKGATNPVEMTSWNEAVEFCKRLSAKTGRTVRLPTEAEREYACRAGTATKYFFGDDAKNLADYAWYTANSGGTTHPVGQKKPNPWGLYDMHGNVWEWCSDWEGPVPPGPVTDPQGPENGYNKVLRPGAVNLDAGSCNSTYRGSNGIDSHNNYNGFRVVVSMYGPPPK
jgi:formylglycine-generating enzyme required for sulfatase activity